MKNNPIHVIIILMIFILSACNAEKKFLPGNFYAYYTSYGEEDKISGPFPDVVVNLDKMKQIIFSRETSYLPFLTDGDQKYLFDQLVDRNGDGTPERPDKNNIYSYVRIIENDPEKIVIHWRYIPNFEKVSFTGVVHEYFNITPDGIISREIKMSEKDLVDWRDSVNKTIQVLDLSGEGLKQISLTQSSLSAMAIPKINANPVISKSVIDPIFWLPFDEGTSERKYSSRNKTMENKSQKLFNMEGNISLYKAGISGSALAFDGYYSKLDIAKNDLPKIEEGFTCEAWIVLGAYPWKHGSVIDATGTNGFYFGINDIGQLLFYQEGSMEEQTILSDKEIPLYKWTHVAFNYDNTNETVTLFIDGQKEGFDNIKNRIINFNKNDLSIGLNKKPLRTTQHVSRDYPPDDRTPEGNQPRIFGIEGIIDEIKIYDQCFDANQIFQSYEILNQTEEFVTNPDLEKRILPGHVDGNNANQFGAYYTKLKYHELWDNLWRSSDYCDVVVRFDELPANVVYWRGPNYGPGWVTENNIWMSDQSAEIYHYYGCAEHMADKENRHSHVRVIENHDARVLVHWRYASVDIMYGFENEFVWADEYHYIYPDGTAIRHVTFHDEEIPGWQDVQFFAQAGSAPEDQINLQALTVANLDGEKFKMDWTDGIPQNKLDDAVVSLINFKSDYKVMVIYPEDQIDGIGAWGERERATTETHFAGPWNHWPVSQMPNDGRYAMRTDRVTHSALGGGGPRDYALFGFTNKSIDDIIPLGRFWNRPPEIEILKGGSSSEFLKSEKAYHITTEGDSVSFVIKATKDSPLINPAFVLKNWNSEKVSINVNNQRINPDKDCRIGKKYTGDGIDLIVWLRLSEFENVSLSFGK